MEHHVTKEQFLEIFDYVVENIQKDDYYIIDNDVVLYHPESDLINMAKPV